MAAKFTKYIWFRNQLILIFCITSSAKYDHGINVCCADSFLLQPREINLSICVASSPPEKQVLHPDVGHDGGVLCDAGHAVEHVVRTTRKSGKVGDNKKIVSYILPIN